MTGSLRPVSRGQSILSSFPALRVFILCLCVNCEIFTNWLNNGLIIEKRHTTPAYTLASRSSKSKQERINEERIDFPSEETGCRARNGAQVVEHMGDSGVVISICRSTPQSLPRVALKRKIDPISSSQMNEQRNGSCQGPLSLGYKMQLWVCPWDDLCLTMKSQNVLRMCLCPWDNLNLAW